MTEPTAERNREDALDAAAGFLRRAELAIFDFDDTIGMHNPDYQRLLALQAIMTSAGFEKTNPDSFVNAFESIRQGDGKMARTYLARVRAASQELTGRQELFEDAVDAFVGQPNDGEQQKNALRVLPMYSNSLRGFWDARATLIGTDLHPAAISLRPGIEDLIRSLHASGCKLAIVSNSRRSLVVDPLTTLAPDITGLFSDIITTVDEGIPRKPAPESFSLLQQRHPDIQRQRTVYVGNALEDAQYGGATGINTIILSSDEDRISRNSQNSTAHIRSFEALLDKLGISTP